MKIIYLYNCIEAEAENRFYLFSIVRRKHVEKKLHVGIFYVRSLEIYSFENKPIYSSNAFFIRHVVDAQLVNEFH